LLTVLLLAGCAATDGDGAAGITITVTRDGCGVAPTSAASGTVQFTVVNESEEVAAFAVSAAGDALGGIGNIAPGISRDVLVDLAAGDYVAECTAGPTASAVATAFTVTDSGVTVPPSASDEGVSEAYSVWVLSTATTLRDTTAQLADAFVTGAPEAQQLYRETRAVWTSLGPAVQQFPELLPALDARESDLVAGERLSGWHAIERDLWPPSDYEALDADSRAELAAELQADLAELLDRVEGAAAMGADAIARGAQELMDAASRSLSDGDERWSHAERWLVQGDLNGAEAAIDALRPLLAADQLAVIDERIDRVQEALDGDVTQRELATRIDALATAFSMIDLRAGRIEP
jgi:iron uptake system component EfeO